MNQKISKMGLSWTRLCIGFLIGLIAYGELEAASIHHRKHSKSERKCGYDGCPKPKANMLNVHIVAHTHDDVGWLKTVDQYYYGSRIKTQKASVQNILDSVIDSLLKDPNKRFIYVESAFFFKWWDHQTKELKKKVKMLVNEGRLEFIGGAWSMNDEAATHYHSTVDQFTYGLRKLNDTFGECGRPKIGWQIDPFGHARELASLLAQMGYDGLFFGRIDYQDKIERLTKHNGEVIWQASDNLGSKADLFSGVLYNNYSPPPGFCFDSVLCSDDPIVDDKSSPEYNLDRKLDDLLLYFEQVKRLYRSNNILITMGEDFNYQDAPAWFKNLDKLILHMNERQLAGLKVNMFYSTPSCYLKAVHDSGAKFSTKKDDYFPYASDPHSFWTGYFTSRPTLKRFERIGNHYLQVCKQLSVLAKKKTSRFEKNLNNLREVMGIMQHHDAVSGTEKQHVADDYARLLQIGIDKCSENIKEALNQLSIDEYNDNSEIAQNEENNKKFQFDYVSCADLNISSCQITENSEKFMVTLYNGLAHSTFQYVRVPVPDSDYEILDYRNVPVSSQLVSIPSQVQSLSFRQSTAKKELVFMASELPPLGYKSYFVQKKSSSQMAGKVEPVVTLVTNAEEFMNDDPFAGVESGPITIGNEYLSLTFGENGLLESVATEQAEMKVRQNFYLYEGCIGNNEIPRNRSSGAYIFRPKGDKALEIVNRADVRVIKGDLVDEVHQTFNEWISQVVRIYKNENYAEFQWLVGPIPVEGNVSREIITRFDTDIESNGIFYTDSNGREMLKRKRNHRDTWNLVLAEQVSGNYYPVTAKIAIEDERRRFAILNDRAQGGSSLDDGSIEIMVHRRLLHDDAFGVGEALNETAFGKGLIARGSHYLVFGPKQHTAKQSTEAKERFIQLKTLLPSWLLFSDVTDLSYNTWKDSYNHIFSGLSLPLPQNIHLLTFEPWKADSILVRFEHILEKNEDQQYSKPVSFDFHDVFRGLNVASIRETTLSANQWLDEAKRLNFTAKIENLHENRSSIDVFERDTILQSHISGRHLSNRAMKDPNDLTITLNPMEIRTFIVELE